MKKEREMESEIKIIFHFISVMFVDSFNYLYLHGIELQLIFCFDKRYIQL